MCSFGVVWCGVILFYFLFYVQFGVVSVEIILSSQCHRGANAIEVRHHRGAVRSP
jgi:hypothetical protein